MKSLLSDNFYKVIEINSTEEPEKKVDALLELNPCHSIYGGHFPGNPVVPGVCLIQMIREVLSQHLNKELIMTKAQDAKFLNIVNPELQARLKMEIKIKPAESEGMIQAVVLIHNGDQVCMKFKGTFKQG